MRLTSDDKSPTETYKIKVKCELFENPHEALEVDFRDDEDMTLLAMVDVTRDDPAAHYNKKLASLKANREKPCPMKFLAEGISQEYVQLMRGLQFLDSKIDPDALINLARRVKQDEFWVRSTLNTHTPLEAAISAGFTEFGSETADEIAKILISRGAPLVRYSMTDTKLGGPTSSPIHMLMSRGQFARLNDLLQVAKNVGRLDTERESVVRLLMGDFATTAKNPYFSSPLWHCIHCAMGLKFLQSPFCRDNLQTLARSEDEATKFRAEFASYALRAAALGIIARNPQDFAQLFTEQSDVDLRDSFAGMPIHRCVEGGSKNALPVPHAKKLFELLDTSIVMAYDASGRTVLHWAIAAGNVPIVEALLERFPALCNLPTRPNKNDPWPENQHVPFKDEWNALNKNFNSRFEPLRQNAIKNRSTAWGADSSDPSTFRSLVAAEGKYPLELASELHNVYVEPLVIILASKSDISNHKVIDRTLANIVSKKFVTNNGLNAVLNLTFELPRLAVAEGVVRRNKDFLRLATAKFGPLNVVLKTYSAYWEPVTGLIKDWKSKASPSRKSRRDGLKALVACARTPVETAGEETFHRKRVTSDSSIISTPMALAIQNNFDLDMVRFLQSECQCYASASFLEQLYSSKQLKLADDDEGKERNGQLAKRCEPYYVHLVLRNAVQASAEEIQRAADIIDFLVQHGVFLGDQNLAMKEQLLHRFLVSNFPLLCSENSGFVQRFISNYLQLTPDMTVDGDEQLLGLKEDVVRHLANSGFTQWHLLPTKCLRKWIKTMSFQDKFPGERGDENEDGETENEDKSSHDGKSRFLAILPEGDESYDPYCDKGIHRLLIALYANPRRTCPYNCFIGSTFKGNICDKYEPFSTQPKQDMMNSATIGKGRSSLVKFLVDKFWTEESGIGGRGHIFNVCRQVQTFFATRYELSSNENARTLNYLINKANSSGLNLALINSSSLSALAHPFEGQDLAQDARDASQLLNTFGTSISRSLPYLCGSSGHFLKKTGLIRFAQDSIFVNSLLSNQAFASQREDIMRELVHIAFARKDFLGIIENYSQITLFIDSDEELQKKVNLKKAYCRQDWFESNLAATYPELAEGKNIFDITVFNENASFDCDFLKIAIGAHGSFFDDWCVAELRQFFNNSTNDCEKFDKYENWHRFENFLARVANASRTTQKRNDEVNPIFSCLLSEGLPAIKAISFNNMCRLYNAIIRSVQSSALPATLKAVAAARDSADFNNEDPEEAKRVIDLEYKAYNTAINRPFVDDRNHEKGCGGSDYGDETVEDIPFSWDTAYNSVINKSLDIELARVIFIIIGRDDTYNTSRRNTEYEFVRAYLTTWADQIGNGDLDMSIVDFLFHRAAYNTQSKIIKFLLNGGQYFNEQVFKGRALATFLFEKLGNNASKGSFGTRSASADKARVDVLDLGTRFSCDPAPFVDAYSEEVDTVLRNECAQGNPVAIEVIKRCRVPLMATEQFKEKGPYRVHDNLILYDPDVTSAEPGLFKANYDLEVTKEERDNEEDDGYQPASSPEWSKHEPNPFDRFLFLTFRKQQRDESRTTRMSPQELEDFLSTRFSVSVDIASNVCANSILQNPVCAAKIRIPLQLLFLSAYAYDFEERVKNECGDISEDVLEHLKSLDLTLGISTSTGFQGWCYIEYDKDKERIAIKIRPDALQNQNVPEEVSFAPELDRIYQFGLRRAGAI